MKFEFTPWQTKHLWNPLGPLDMLIHVCKEMHEFAFTEWRHVHSYWTIKLFGCHVTSCSLVMCE